VVAFGDRKVVKADSDGRSEVQGTLICPFAQLHHVEQLHHVRMCEQLHQPSIVNFGADDVSLASIDSIAFRGAL